MQTSVKNSNGIQELSIEGRLTGSRVLFLEGKIDEQAVSRFAQQVLALTLDDPQAPINLFLDSPGGNIGAGLTICNIVEYSTTPIAIYCLGRVASMGATILAAGRHGRYIMPHSLVMLHEPGVDGLTGQASSVRELARSLTQSKHDMDELLARYTGQSLKTITALTRSEHYLLAPEAVAKGFADKIVNFAQIQEAIA